MSNYMPEVARMLGVEIGEEFDVVGKDGKLRGFGPYRFLENMLVDRDGDTPSDSVLFYLLNGEYTIQKRPWRPKEGDEYWVVYPDGHVTWYPFHKHSPSDLAVLTMGNCFPSKEAAEAAAPEMLAKFEEIKKGVRE